MTSLISQESYNASDYNALRSKIPFGTVASITLDGYHTAGDGGGGVFHWDSTSSAGDNVGTIVVPIGSSSGRWKRIYDQTYLSVKWFGAYGDNSHDDTAFIKQTIASAITTAVYSVKFPSGIYCITSEITVPGISPALSISGTGGEYSEASSTVKAVASFRSIFNVAGEVHIHDLGLNCNALANFGICRNGDSLSVYERLDISSAFYDGIHANHFADSPPNTDNINDNSTFNNCNVSGCGHAFVGPGFTGLIGLRDIVTTGTVAINSGSNIIVGTGTTFTTMNIRVGDFIKVGNSAEAFFGDGHEYQIQSVTDNTHLVVSSLTPPQATLTGQPFGVFIGFGYYEEPSFDANINVINGGLWRLNYVAGMCFMGLVGPTVRSPQIDYSGVCAISIGADVIGPNETLIERLYVEATPFAAVQINNAVQVTVLGYTGPAPGVSCDPRLTNVTGLCLDFPTSTDRNLSHTPGLHVIGTPSQEVDFTARFGGNTNLFPFTLNGPLIHFPAGAYFNTIVGPPSIPITSSNALVGLNNLTADFTVTNTPSIDIGLYGGQQLILINTSFGSGGYNVTLQDETILSGSRLSLLGPTFTIGPGELAQFIWSTDNTRWIQISQSYSQWQNNNGGTSICRGHLTTTNNTPTTIIKFPMYPNVGLNSSAKVMDIEADVVAITDGYSSGVWKGVEATYVCDGVTMTLVGSVTTRLSKGTNGGAVPAGWNISFATTGTSVLFKVTGPSSPNVTWQTIAKVTYKAPPS